MLAQYRTFLLGMGLVLHFAAPAQAITVGSISNKTITAGVDWTQAATASGSGSPYIIWSVDWADRYFSERLGMWLCGVHQDFPVITSSSITTSTTFTWEGHHNAMMLGSSCLYVKACEYYPFNIPPSTGECDEEYILATVSPSDQTLQFSMPRIYGHEYVEHVAGDAVPLEVPLIQFASRVELGYSVDQLLELVSCPSGWSCSPPTLPSWVDIDHSSRYGPRYTMLFPEGPPGDWTFRAKMPPLAYEYEYNDDFVHASFLSTEEAPRASINPSTDVDTFSFYAHDGDVIDVWTSTSQSSHNTCASGVDTYITLLNPSGSEVDSDDYLGAGSCSRINYTATQEGWFFLTVEEDGNNSTISTYYVHLNTPTGRSVKDFKVRLLEATFVDPSPAIAFEGDKLFPEWESKNNSAATAPSLIGSGIASGALYPAGDEDYYAFYTHAFVYDSIAVLDRDGGCSSDTVLTLYEKLANGTLVQLAQSDDWGAGTCPRIENYLTEPGHTYIVKVEEDGGDDPVYQYALIHRPFVDAPEPDNNDPSTAPELWGDGEDISPGITGAWSTGEDHGGIRAGVSAADPYDYFIVSIDDGHRVIIDTSDGFGGCPGNTYLRLYRYNEVGRPEPGTFSWGDTTLVAANDNSGIGTCARLTYTTPGSDNYYIIRLSRQGSAAVDPVVLYVDDYSEYDTTSSAKWKDQDEWASPFTYDKGASADPATTKYGGYLSAGGFHARSYSINSEFFPAYFSEGTTASSCDPINAYLFGAEPKAYDADGACRSFEGSPLTTSGSSSWRKMDTFYGTFFGFVPGTSDVGNRSMVHFVAADADRSYPSRSTGTVEILGGEEPSVAEIETEYGSNHFHSDIVLQCGSMDYFATGTCTLDSTYKEGDRVVIYFARWNRLTTATLTQCSDDNFDACGSNTTSASYSSSSDYFLWEIPYTAVTSGTSTFYFKVDAPGSASRGEMDAAVRLSFHVQNRSGPPSGSDLLIQQVREKHPMGYRFNDRRLYSAGLYFSLISFNPARLFYPHIFSHNEYYGKSLAANNFIYIHPLFEMGDLGDPSGPAELSVRIKNRGGATSSSTYMDAYLVPAVAGTGGQITADPPEAGDTPLSSHYVSATSSGSVRTVNVPLPVAAVMPYAGAYPWEGFTTALYLKLRGGAQNNLAGPFIIKPPPPIPSGLCMICIPPNSIADTTGYFSEVSNESPQTNDTVSVTVLTQYNPTWVLVDPTGAYLRFYVDQEDLPTSATSYTEQKAHDTSPVADVPYAHVFTFTADKPDETDNTIHMRVLLDATNVQAEGTSGESNNHLPAISGAYDLEIDNTLPSFSSQPGTVNVTEDTLWSYNFSFTDMDDVDLSRMSFFVIDGPSGLATNGSIYSCGSSLRCQNTRYTPTDADAVTGTHSATVRICDGDPVAGGDGDCSNHNFSFSVTRVNDPPEFTTPTGPTSATENVTYTHDVDATDEEGTTLTYALVSRPSGMTINSSTGYISWTPGDNDVGIRTVRVRVTDQQPAGTSGRTSSYQQWSITVANVNDAPRLSTLSPTTGTEATSYVALARIYDDDVDIAGISQTLTCALGTGAPSWLSASAVTQTGNRYCRVSGTPDNPDTGTQDVPVTASDNAGGSDAETYSITISDVNQAPSFTTTPGTQSATQGSQWSLRLYVDDPDMDSPAAAETLTYSQTAGPTVTLTPAGNQESVLLTWTPSADDANSTPTIAIEVEDRRGSTDTVSFSFGTIGNINDPPYWDPAPTDITISEGDPLTTSLAASDPDSDVGLSETLSFSIQSGEPADMVVNSSSGALGFSTTGGLADDAQVGIWTITVRVADDESPTPAFVDAQFDLTVTNVNDTPEITSSPDLDAYEDSTYSYTLAYDDPDSGDSHTLSALTLPDWLEFNDSTGLLSNKTGRPNNADVGVHNVELEVEDGLPSSDTQSFTITVHNSNDIPVFTSTAVTAATQDQSYTYSATATDDDLVHGDNITLSAPTLPGWLTFNPVSGALSGTPSNGDVGDHSVVLRVTDLALDYTEQPFTIAVANVNDAPVLTPIGSKSVAEDETLTFGVSASDPDGTTPTITVTPATLPTGASFDGATFIWTTSFGDEGSYLVEFVASDTILDDREWVTISVGDVPRPPTLDPVGDRSVDEAASLQFTVTASDPDVGDNLTLTAAGGASDPFAAGASFDTNTGLFSWTPGYTAAGSYTVTFTVTDSTSLEDSETITITVADVNRAPSFTATPPSSSDEDQSFVYVASASDPDNDTLSWSLTTAPAGMTINSGDGTVSWLPDNDDVGSHSVEIEVDDGKPGGSVAQSFTLQIQNVNDSPVITSTPDTAVAQDAAYTYTLTAIDDDAADVLTLSAPTLPAWLTFVASSGLLSGTPDNGDVGDHSVVLRATDLAGDFAEQPFTITVSNINDPPELVDPTPSGTVSGAEGTTMTFTVAATDLDGPALSYGGTGLPAGATLDPATGVFTWTPGYDEAGSRSITVFADDTLTRTNRDLTLDVANTDRDPELTAPALVSGPEGQLLEFWVSATDPDGDAVALEMTAGPAGSSFDDSTGRFSWTPDYSGAGEHQADFSATANGAVVTATTTLQITNVNRAPVITSTPPSSGSEDVALSYDVDATDPDGQTVRYILVSAPAGSALDENSGLLVWTPNGNQTGDQAFDILVTDDSGGNTNHVFTVEILAVNDPPQFTSIPVVDATEDVPYTYAAYAVDEEDPTLSYVLLQSPLSMTVDQQTGLVTWLPQNDDVGEHTIILQASDSGLATATQNFTVMVANVNDAPVFEDIPAPAFTVLEGSTWSWTPALTDVDVGDSATLALVQNPAEMALLDGTVSWTPGNDDVGEHNLRFSAEDTQGAITFFDHQLTVVNLNDPPFFTSPAVDMTVAEEEAIALTVTADDIDDGDQVTFTLVDAPSSASIDPDSGLLTFAPDDPDVGSHDFFVHIQDLNGGDADQSVRFVVTPVNDPPVLELVGNQQVAMEGTLTITLTASDPDGPAASFTMSDAPAGANLVDNVFTWTTTIDDAGQHVVTFAVSDGDLQDSETITIVVGDGGLPPNLYLPEDISVDEGETVTASITAQDPQTLQATSVHLANPPDGASFDSVTGNFAWTPGFDSGGLYALTFSASNTSGHTARIWNITVRDLNRAPMITTLVLPEANEGVAYSVTIEASDPDSDTLSFTLLSGPGDMAIDSSTGVILFAPVYADTGARNVDIRVSDGNGGITDASFTLVVHFMDDDQDSMPDTWEVQMGTDPTLDDSAHDTDSDGLTHLEEYQNGTDPFVSNAPTAPSLLLPVDQSRVASAQPTLSWTASTDPDGDAITYGVQVAPDNDPSNAVFVQQDIVLTETEGSIAVDFPLDEGVVYRWSVFASDGIGSRSSEERVFVVDAVNEAPPMVTLLSPENDTVVAEATPELLAAQAQDPDGDVLTYRYIMRESREGPEVITSGPIVAPETGPVSFVVPQLLAHNSTWFWEVQATDNRGLAGPLSEQYRFTVNLMNQAPPAPELIAPVDNSQVTASNATLILGAVQDPEGQAVTYRLHFSPDGSFDIASTQIFQDLVAQPDANRPEDTVQFDLSGLTPDGTWWWRGYAFDGEVQSPPVAASFVLNLVDEPPPAPAPLSPADNSEVSSLVSLIASTVLDPDGEELTYRFELTSATGDTVLESVDNVQDIDDGSEDNQVLAEFANLTLGQRYGWQVQAVEADGQAGPYSDLRTFRVANENLRPQAPVLLSPIEQTTVTSARPQLRWQLAVDPEGDNVAHQVEVYNAASLLVANGDQLLAESGQVVFSPAVDLPNGDYSWRARGSDLVGPGPWANAAFSVQVQSNDGGPQADTLGQDTTGQDTTGQDTTGQDTTGQDTTGQDTTGQDTTGQDTQSWDQNGVDRRSTDAGVYDIGIYDNKLGVVTDVGYRPLRSSCSDCSGAGATGSLLALCGLWLWRRRRFE